MPSLKVEHVTKRFANGLVALDDVSLETSDGEYLAIIGPSGSGKTTLLRCIAGLEKLDAGQIRLGERQLDHLPPRQRDVAMVFQQPALYPHLKVRDNIAFPLRMRGVNRRLMQQRVAEIAQQLEISSLLDRRPQQLSGGQAQRVALARALIRQPQCLLLDEPLSNLDAPLRAELRGMLKALHQQRQITTLHVTHDMTEAMELSNRAVVIDLGKVIFDGPLREASFGSDHLERK